MWIEIGSTEIDWSNFEPPKQRFRRCRQQLHLAPKRLELTLPTLSNGQFFMPPFSARSGPGRWTFFRSTRPHCLDMQHVLPSSKNSLGMEIMLLSLVMLWPMILIALKAACFSCFSTCSTPATTTGPHWFHPSQSPCPLELIGRLFGKDGLKPRTGQRSRV